MESINVSLTSQLHESSNKLSESCSKLSEVEKNYKLLTGDCDALSNISLEQCDELILTLTRSQEKLQQRRVSDEPYIYTIIAYTKKIDTIYLYNTTQ